MGMYGMYMFVEDVNHYDVGSKIPRGSALHIYIQHPSIESLHASIVVKIIIMQEEISQEGCTCM